MAPSKGLPLPPEFEDEEAYIESLLHFVTSNELFQHLCGGVHILDFMTQEPELYSTLLPVEWRAWFEYHSISDVLDLLMREDISSLVSNSHSWRGGPGPPQSLLQYIRDIRRHTLDRQVCSVSKKNKFNDGESQLAKHVVVGMKPKKIHEVQCFAKYIDQLTSNINSSSEHHLSHIVDFGSGQNYLGRALASPPYCKDVVAIESKQHNIDGAKTMDIHAKLAEKEKIIRNKKEYRLAQKSLSSGLSTKATSQVAQLATNMHQERRPEEIVPHITNYGEAQGSLQYFESIICNGDLSGTIDRIRVGKATSDPQLMVISLHSCGNLVHHGLRSLILNPSVKAVAMVGCCYNLMTERLGPPTYKLPCLRQPSERLKNTSNACDPNGFPMSQRLAAYKHHDGEGIRMNITARMMAVQAPKNWTPNESESFFTRHFFRALLQRILVDHGVLGKPAADARSGNAQSPRGWSGPGQAIILGSLRKSCYSSFVAYVLGAFAKLREDSIHGEEIRALESKLTDEDIIEYENAYRDQKKKLSVVWSLMAFSAGVVESTIVIDRWLYLREQKEVQACWVEAVFDYEQSPRNLVVVGVKR